MSAHFPGADSPASLVYVAFYAAGGLLLYVWFLYPALLAILSIPRKDRELSCEGQAVEQFPFISMIVAAYNEEQAIERTIRGFLESNYPGESELLIVSDGSTDRTAEIALGFLCDRVRLVSQSSHLGKGAALARALPRARGDILVFSDATSAFEPQTLTELVRPFANEKVGLVTGRVRVEGSAVAGLYRKYEEAIESIEARGGVISTAHGCVYALRRSLSCPHDSRLTNDFFHPILVNLRGFYVVVAPKAVCTESYSPESRVQFTRQVRMVSLAAFVYIKYLPVLIFTGKWRSLFVLTSHKALRWLTVPYLAILAVASMLLASQGTFYAVAFCAQLLFWCAVLAGASSRVFGFNSRLTFAWDFVTLNWAGTIGLWKFWQGHLPTDWETTILPSAAARNPAPGGN
jgi:biofilm PGA synthesis N-glycosyltransferase PgaC